MTQEHPITPPPELLQQWWDGTHGAFYEFEAVATQAARWGADQQLKLDTEQINQAWQKGADQELEACCAAEHTVYGKGKADWLRSWRRPKPRSLKEQALEALDRMDQLPTAEDQHIIRRALEALPE